MIRVLVVDDHSVVREGLKRILEDAGDISVAGEAADGRVALAMALRGGFDVVVTDISMPGREGLELVAELRRLAPKLRVLVLSVHGEDQIAIRALRSGAAGYLTKETAPEELVIAIRKVARGGRYVSAPVAEKLAARLDPEWRDPLHEKLSDREFQVLTLMAKGRTPTQIAEEMALSVKTVSTYRSRLLEKMGFKTSAEAIAYAVRQHLVD